MEKINPVVRAKVATELARARQEVAKLESRQRTAAVNTGGSWRGVNTGKLLTEARWQAESWERLAGAMAGLGDAAVEAAALIDGMNERVATVMAWMSNAGKYICTRPACLQSVNAEDVDWFPQTATQLDGTETCAVCGTGIM